MTPLETHGQYVIQTSTKERNNSEKSAEGTLSFVPSAIVSKKEFYGTDEASENVDEP
jgi:hypothetical protein